ncbi:NAD(P)H dehydrogenase C1 [Striga asiatica]|uniref:NAD(P)H dehydrogenase C1 n=1 Tax=Striga asiatica TaxID=4170 RepID=A0A5A7PC03_STRAF|nr:NAD(P)H dehydrogenase C1 [Striga asiatica]
MALAVSSITSLTLLRSERFPPVKSFELHSRRLWTYSMFFSTSAKSPQLRVLGSSSGGGFGVVSAISETEFQPSSFVWPDNRKRPRVCILGGGFGGLYTALRLESLDWPDGKKPQVVLVDRSEHFVFKPLLYELLCGEVDEWEIAPRFSDLLSSTGVQFLKDNVQSLLPFDQYGMDGDALTHSAGVVHLESGLLIEYDWLVLALGAEAKLDVVPGATEYALPFTTLEDARRVNEKLRTLEREFFGKDSPIRVAVVGCGYSGIELAATISERLQTGGVVQAVNVQKTILPNATPGNRESALKKMRSLYDEEMHFSEIAFIPAKKSGLHLFSLLTEVLASRNVQLLLGYFVCSIKRVAQFDYKVGRQNHERLKLELQPAERGLQSQDVEADLVLWTVGSKPVLPQHKTGDKPIDFPLNSRGQADTDETLRVEGHPRIFAIGDSSAVKDGHGNLLPNTAQVAFQQADFAGWNLWAAINGRPLLPFRFQNLGEMLTLGRYDASVSPSFTDGLTLEGPIGHTARKIAYLSRLPTDEHRLKVGISWLTKAAVESTALLLDSITKVPFQL